MPELMPRQEGLALPARYPRGGSESSARIRPGGRTTGRTLSWLTGAMVTLAGASAPGQDALISSLAVAKAVQPAQNAVANLAPDQPHLGPVQLSLGLYSSVSYSDNINYSQTDPVADAILRAGANVGFFWPATPQSDLSLSSRIGYAYYVKNPQLSYVEVAPNSALAWNVFFDDGWLTFFDQFSYSQNVANEPALSGIVIFPVLDNTIGARVNWLPSQWQFQAGYSHDNYFSDSSAFEYLNRSSEYFFTRGAWRFAENTQAGLEASASLTKYQVSAQSGTESISVGPYAEWQITQAIHATLRGGPTLYFFDSSGGSSQGSSLNSYYVGLQVSHQLTDFLSHQIGVQRNVSLGVNAGSSYLEQLTANYSASLALTPKIALSANLSYVQGSQTFQNLVLLFPGFGFLLNQTENFDQYAVGPSVAWQFREKLAASLSYNYYLRESNIAGRGYKQNSVTLSLSYAF